MEGRMSVSSTLTLPPRLPASPMPHQMPALLLALVPGHLRLALPRRLCRAAVFQWEGQ